MHGPHEAGPTPVLPLHPLPINFQVILDDRGGRTETSVARVWRIEDARRCRLCESCTATVSGDGQTALCLKKHDGPLSIEEAPLFRDTTGVADVGVALYERSGTVA